MPCQTLAAQSAVAGTTGGSTAHFHVLLTAIVTSAVTALPTVSAVADDDTANHYYLALGDSITAGDQFFVPGQPFYSPTGCCWFTRRYRGPQTKLDLNNVSCRR